MMENLQQIHIDGKEYYIIDSIQNLRAEDSFIYNKNKLAMFDGAGEARKYVGSYIGSNGSRLSDFFAYTRWGDTKIAGKRSYPTIQQGNCFFSKTNLLKYLFDARVEYQQQEQIYHNDISQYYDDYLHTINSLSSDLNFFSIYDVSDFLENKLSRAYIRSDDDIWKIWRKIVLPKISYLSILKLIPIKINNGNTQPLFYFRIFLDYQFRSIVHPQLTQSIIQPSSTESKVAERSYNRRIGADMFRKKVIEHMPQCPFSKISEEKLLIASHIKPYNICIKEGQEDQAIDYLNGLALTPTYDKLFDQGYITFTDKGHLICGTQLSAYTWEKLNINPNAKSKMRIYPEDREPYLDYHRRFVFQDNIDDFV